MERASWPQVHASDGRALGPELGDLCWGSEQNVPKTLSVRPDQDSRLPPPCWAPVSQIPAPTLDLHWALGTHDHVPEAHGVHAQVWQKGKRPLLGSFLRPSACAPHLRAQRRQVKPRFCPGLRSSTSLTLTHVNPATRHFRGASIRETWSTPLTCKRKKSHRKIGARQSRGTSCQHAIWSPAGGCFWDHPLLWVLGQSLLTGPTQRV